MKKIGILTKYYKNENYGGLLQAYALVKHINENYSYCNARQITYRGNYIGLNLMEKCVARRKNLAGAILEKTIRIVKNNYWKLCNTNEFDKRMENRRKTFAEFAEKIPHSQEVKESDLINLNKQYDIFIVGSDQVWNPTLYKSAYFLNFVKNNTIKVAYAASMGVNNYPTTRVERAMISINFFDYVSVREQTAANIIRKYLPEQQVEIVLDPVFLLSANEWDEIVADCLVKTPYIYTYFLGDSSRNRKLAKKISGMLCLPIVNIPYAEMKYNSFERKYSDILIDKDSPEDFVSLIKNAELVLTDSFHATAFSIIYQKDFYSFNRFHDSLDDSMNSRIHDLLRQFNLQNRLITSSKQVESNEFMKEKINWEKTNQILNEKIIESKRFLWKAIKLS